MKTLMAKEKAKELVQRFIDAETLKDFQDMDMYLAKQCAIIAVDEILNIEELIDWDFWSDVKLEIEKL